MRGGQDRVTKKMTLLWAGRERGDGIKPAVTKLKRWRWNQK